ncbi:MAG TPA: radical SAM protein [Planctomycetota bacterium]|nr:radical SAM protein [Planctomycetota bacterium]
MTSLPVLQRKSTDHIYYSLTKSLCASCKKAVDAKIVFKSDQVWFDKFCPEHGHQTCLVASSVEWYLDALSFIAPNTPPKRVMKEVKEGCPFDCGACPSHQQKVYLPVVPITSGCNLDCPICYTVNKNERAYKLTKEEMGQILEHLLEDHAELDIINFTGGEPTLHPELPELLQMCRDAGIRRLTISTNGLKLKDESYVRKLAALDARIVLSLDTFDPAVDMKLLGANTVKTKLHVLDLLEKHDVTTTILPAVAAGLNDAEVGRLFDLVISKPNICSLELHTMTFTGQGGVGFDRSARISIPDLHRCLEKSTGGRVQWRDFVPSPLAHPHCYSICYLLCLDESAGGPRYVPFTRFLSRQTLFDLLGDSLYIQPRKKLEDILRTTIDDLWANPEKLPESEAVLRTLKRLLRDMFPPGQQPDPERAQKISERAVKAIYIHSHMDEESFDVSRIMKCCVGVPSPDGTNIPTCSYNVLYREKDHRFADPEMIARMKATRPVLPLAPASPTKEAAPS